jgi:hypothetical protein
MHLKIAKMINFMLWFLPKFLKYSKTFGTKGFSGTEAIASLPLSIKRSIYCRDMYQVPRSQRASSLFALTILNSKISLEGCRFD